MKNKLGLTTQFFLIKCVYQSSGQNNAKKEKNAIEFKIMNT